MAMEVERQKERVKELKDYIHIRLHKVQDLRLLLHQNLLVLLLHLHRKIRRRRHP
jgi:hypothetical protein